MKFVLIISFFSALFLTSSCTNSTEKSKGYACPMECEGKKIYEKAGQCPVCEMDLEKM